MKVWVQFPSVTQKKGGTHMEKFVKIDEKYITRANPNKFAVLQVAKSLAAGSEYLIDGAWKPGPPSQKPDGRRIVFELEKFRAGRDAYFAWQELQGLIQFTTEKPEEVFTRIKDARLAGVPLTLFVPWGVRPQGVIRLEPTVLDIVEKFQANIAKRNIPTQVLLMPADIYATDINSINPRKTGNYFATIKELAQAKGFMVKPWSEIREENRDEYERRSSELTPAEIDNLLGRGKVLEAFSTSSRRSGYTRQRDIERAAYAYLRERVCEAEIVEAQYKPIKVSAVGKNKDNLVDRDLPRVYIVPEAYQFPWLK